MARSNKPRPSQPLPPPSKPSPFHRAVQISFKFYEPGAHHCLMHCESKDIKLYMDCMRRITSMTHAEILMTGRKGEGKTGLNHTVYDLSALRGVKPPENIPTDVAICGLRSGSGRQLFGFIFESVLYVLWFDPGHEIVKA